MLSAQVERNNHVVARNPVGPEAMDLFVSRDAPCQRRIEAAASWKSKPLAKQSDPLPNGADGQSWSGWQGELRKASPLLLVAHEAAAQIRIERVDRLDEI